MRLLATLTVTQTIRTRQTSTNIISIMIMGTMLITGMRVATAMSMPR